MGPPPLVVKPWFDPMVHWTERVNWLNSDKMRELLAINPMLEPIIIQHLTELQMVLAPPVDPNDPNAQNGGQQKTGGGGQAMSNSNTNSGSTQGAKPSQSKRESGPNQGNK